MIRFQILGAGGAVPTPTHTPAAYLVTVESTPILVDPGPGALVRAVRTGQLPGGVDDLNVVLLSHLHPDHCADLVPLLFALHSVVPQSTAPMDLYGPVGLVDYLEAQRTIYGNWLEPRRRELRIKELNPGDGFAVSGGGRVDCFAAKHPQDRFCRQPLGYRFFDSDDRTAVFSGDTEACPGLENAAKGAELLVVECSTPDELATPGHMTPTLVGELCKKTRPGLVALTHQYPAAAEQDLAALIHRIYSGPVHQAQDGDVFTVPCDGDIPAEEVRSTEER